MNADFLHTTLIQGLAFSGLGLGIFFSLRIFNIPDITTDGSYTLGAVVTAIALSAGLHPLLSLVLSLAAGMLAGTCSGLIHTRLKVNPLLAGILVMTALYSINLILLGRPNLPVSDHDTIYTLIPFGSSLSKTIFSLSLLVVSLTAMLLYLLRSDFGIAMRATGNNETMTRAMGVNVNAMKIFGLALANGCTALSGSLLAQYQGFADINMGIGIVISGLAAVMIGEALFGKRTNGFLLYQLVAVCCGGLVFRGVLAFALSAGVDPNYMRLLTSAVVLIIITLGMMRKTSGT